jgi:hypothetical protein
MVTDQKLQELVADKFNVEKIVCDTIKEMKLEKKFERL